MSNSNKKTQPGDMSILSSNTIDYKIKMKIVRKLLHLERLDNAKIVSEQVKEEKYN